MVEVKANKKAMIAGLLGTALQWYDFAIFGYFAPVLALTFFPKDNPIAGLLSAFGAFAVGYLLAPIGSVVFGYIGDRYGRKFALTLSILGMAIPTALIGVLPGYEAIGLWAPILITGLRVIQGFVASAEYTGCAIFLIEHAPVGKKAFYGALTSSAYSAGVFTAGLVTSFLAAAFMPDWAWRIAFIAALVAGLVIFYLRRFVAETPAYQNMMAFDKPKMPIAYAIKERPHAFLGVIGLAWLVGIATFGTYVFAESYLHMYCHISLAQATLITTCGLLMDALLEPCMAVWADRVGHVRFIVYGMILMFCLSVPTYCLFATANMSCMILGMVLMSALIAMTFSPINAYMITLFPPEYRYSGFGVAFHIGISLFGGTTPLLLLWLVNQTNNMIAPAYYYMWGCVVALGALILCEAGRRKTSKQDACNRYNAPAAIV